MGDSRGAMAVPKVCEQNLVFGFNDLDFSDRILRLEITPDFDDDDEPTASGLQSTEDSKSSGAAKVTTLHICTLLLAGQSPFFYKLFKNGMRESLQKTEFCLKINASEEAAFMELLRFMYGETALNATSVADLVDLLIVADKFEVTSCMIYCVEMLNKFPMSLELAMLYVELPYSVLVSEIVKPIIDAAKKLVINHYKCFTKSQDKAMKMPLSALEVILGSEGLQVESEDIVFDFILKWARASYPNLEERREILTKRLTPLICFSEMSVSKLKEVLACIDFDYEHVSKLVHETLFSKMDRSCGQLIRGANLMLSTECGSAGRVYNEHHVILFDLTRHECENLETRRIHTPAFSLGGEIVSITACAVAREGCIGIYMTITVTFEVNLEIAVMKKSSRQFESKLKTRCHLVKYLASMSPHNLNITRAEIANPDCDYFINDVLRLRVALTLTNP